MKIDTILFDLDGTLINTNDLIIASFLHTLDHYAPGRYTKEDVLTFIGEPLETSFERVDANRVKEMVEMYRKHNHENHDILVKEYKGVYETIETLHNQGYKLGVVTTKMRNTVEMGLELTRLKSFFGVVVTLDDVENAKPHPEPVERAMALLDARPEQTIMVGDSRYDIGAGQNAGTYTAAVAWTIKGKETLAALQPDFMLDEMADLLDMIKVGVK
jgi:pyrophosphatase PpaX